jgi:hypothetical protein
MQDYLYVDVILALCKRLIIEEEVNHNKKYHPESKINEVIYQINKEFKDLDDNEELIESVKKIKKEEKRRRAAIAAAKSGVFTAQHEEAARLLIQHLRNYVRRKKI